MSKQSRAVLKTFFETGDVPTQQQFADDIDSSPNFVDDAPSITLSSKSTILTGAILTSFDTPIQIMPDPGVGFATDLLAWAVKLTFNTTKYSTFTNFELIAAGSNTRIGFLSALLPSTQSVFQTGQVVTGLSTNNINIVENAAIFLSAITGNPTGGDSDIIVYSFFRVLTV